MNLLFWRKQTEAEKEKPEQQKVNNKNYKNLFVKAIGLIAKQGSGRDNFEYPEYNLEEIKLASLSDSYVRQSFMKYSYLIYKAGYSLKSDNDKAADYVKKRFRIMSFSTQKPVDILMQEIGDDLLKFSNAFLVKSRDDVRFSGIRARGIFAEKPVAGYFRIDPTSIQIRRDDHGKIIEYQQKVNGKEKKYKKEDVIHFYLDKDPNNNFGTPRIIAALEDVKLLRKIEGNVISLIYRFAIPIYQWMIGSNTFSATDREIEDAKLEIEKLALDGNIVTNERTQIKAIGAEGHALDASGYLKYFENRVFSALGVSDAQMGRGGAKKDADSMEAQIHDTVRYIQRTLSIFIENYMIMELLLEGGFDPISNEEDIVKYVFEETSLETKVKVENHAILKFQSNAITFEELRKDLGVRQDADEDRLFANMITQKAAIEQIDEQGEITKDVDNNAHENSKELAKQQAEQQAKIAKQQAKSAGVKGNGQTKKSGANKDADNRNRPANQHGKTSVKIKESFFDNPVRRKEEENKKVFQNVYKKWTEARNDIDRGEDPDILLGVLKDSLLFEINGSLILSTQDGKERAVKELKTKDFDASALKVPMSQLEEHVNKKITALLKDIRKMLTKGVSGESAFNALEYRLRFLLEFAVPKAYWLAYAIVCREAGFDEVHVDFKDSKDSEEYDSVIDLRKIDWLKIPAFHPFCDCALTLKKVGDK